MLAHDDADASGALAQFNEAAQRIERHGQFVPRPCVIYGPAGVAKAALLRGQRELEASRVRTAWVSADASESLVSCLLSGIELITERAEAASRSSERTASSTVTVTEATHRLVAATRRAAEAVTRDGGAGVAILIDEIQEADAAGLWALAYAWQDIAGASWSTGQVEAALFGAGRLDAPTRLHHAVGISERFDWVRLALARDE